MILFILSVQIILGGWTSTNYAALSCGEEFPKCLGSWWPTMDFINALVMPRYCVRLQLPLVLTTSHLKFPR
jgi:heme A synthase